MPIVDIELDVYDFLRKSVRDFRETESVVLRRLLNLPTPQARKPGSPSPPGSPPNRPGGTPFAQFVADLRSKYHRSATDKFLAILRFAYEQDPPGFERVLQVGGRKRKYFARSRQEIERSGTSTHPRQIPGSDYWVMTNADTRQKGDMLREALKLLGYSDDDIRTADTAVF